MQGIRSPSWLSSLSCKHVCDVYRTLHLEILISGLLLFSAIIWGRGSIRSENLNNPCNIAPTVSRLFKNKGACKTIIIFRCEKDQADHSSLIPCPVSDSQFCLLASLTSKEAQKIWLRVSQPWAGAPCKGSSHSKLKMSVSQGCQAGSFKIATKIKLLKAPKPRNFHSRRSEQVSVWEEGWTERWTDGRTDGWMPVLSQLMTANI